MSKKLIAGAVIVAGIAYVGSSWYFGKVYEDTVYSQVQLANQQLKDEFFPLKVYLTIKDYERGIFSSHASYKLYIEDEEVVELVSTSDSIAHGPLPGLLKGKPQLGLATSKLTLASTELTQPLFELTNNQSLLTVSTRYKFNLDSQSHMTWLPVKYSKDRSNEFADEITQVDFAGAEFWFDTSNQFKDAAFKGTIQASSVTINDVQVKFSPMIFNGSVENYGLPNASSTSTLTMEQLSVNGDDAQVEVNNIELSGNSLAVDNLLQMDARYQVGDLRVNGQSIGNFVLPMQFKNFDQETYSELISLAQSLGSDPSQAMAVQARAGMLILQMLNHNPEISFSPSTWSNEAGTSSLYFDLALAAPKDLASVSDPAEIAEQMLKNIRFKTELSIPMVEKVAQVLLTDEQEFAEFKQEFAELTQKLTKQGVSILEADQLTSEITYQDGVLKLNGTETSPEGLRAITETIN